MHRVWRHAQRYRVAKDEESEAQWQMLGLSGRRSTGKGAADGKRGG
ncbi:TPA: hypothetical protein ACHTOV_004689 [Enterobacter cancerogenus]